MDSLIRRMVRMQVLSTALPLRRTSYTQWVEKACRLYQLVRPADVATSAHPEWQRLLTMSGAFHTRLAPFVDTVRGYTSTVLIHSRRAQVPFPSCVESQVTLEMVDLASHVVTLVSGMRPLDVRRHTQSCNVLERNHLERLEGYWLSVSEPG